VVLAYQKSLGFEWRKSQCTKKRNGMKRKQVLRCRCYGEHEFTHDSQIDPADHREGKTIKKGCMAHLNLNICDNGEWRITLIDFVHNHPPTDSPDSPPTRLPTEQERELIATLATNRKFTRDRINALVDALSPDNPLQPKQISNLINDARAAQRNIVRFNGGDIASVQSLVDSYRFTDPRWVFNIKMDVDSVATAFFWMSPTQVELARRFNDILITDNAANRNQYKWALAVGVIIDNFGHSRNVYYAVQAREDTETHRWILRLFFAVIGTISGLVVSDKDGAFLSAVRIEAPLAYHLFCLFHMDEGLVRNLHSALGDQWDAFLSMFWEVYRSASTDAFQASWTRLTGQFPRSADYLNNELYPSRQNWASPWVSSIFTCGIRTNGRVEVENRVHKPTFGPKTTFLELFEGLNKRTGAQTVAEMRETRQVSLLSVAVLPLSSTVGM
jgi:hypothetical protein